MALTMDVKPLRGGMARHSDVVTSVAFSGDGRTLASGGWDGVIKLWDLKEGPTGLKLERVLRGVWDEVEAVLLQHPGVREAGVFGRPDADWGQAVTAHVVGEADPEELRAWCKQRLAGFKVPKRIEVVVSLPRTASGKLLRRSMR